MTVKHNRLKGTVYRYQSLFHFGIKPLGWRYAGVANVRVKKKIFHAPTKAKR